MLVGMGVALAAAAVLTVGAESASAGSTAFDVSQAQRVDGPFPWPDGCGDGEYEHGFPYPTGVATDARLAIDPRDPARAVVAFQRDVDFGVSVATSQDAGASWQAHEVPAATPCTSADGLGAGDQDLAVGRDGSLVMAAARAEQVASPTGPYPPDEPIADELTSGIALWRSTGDGRRWGAKWTRPIWISEPIGPQHQVQVAIDPRDSRRVVVAWSVSGAPEDTPLEENSIYVASSRDGGRTFDAPRVAYSTGIPNGGVEGGVLLILSQLSFGPDGTLVFAALIDGRLHVARSTDGGRTFAPPTHVADDHYFLVDADGGLTTGGNRPLAWAADGTLYAVATVPPPPAPTDPFGLFRPVERVAVFRSSDGGRRWRSAGVVADENGGAFGAAIAVGSRGAVGVSWIDLADDVAGDERTDARARVAISQDRGRTWRSKPLGPASDLRRSPRFIVLNSNFLGNYQAIAPVPGGFLTAFAATPPPPAVTAANVLSARVTLGRR